MQKLNDFTKRTAKIKKQRARFLEIAKTDGTPLYIYDSQEVKQNISRFKEAFRKEKVNISIFYAIKSNSYIGILKTVASEGEGLDASGQRELKLALNAGAKRIIYTGPAKSHEDFELILKHHQKITIHMDSFNELHTLGKILKNKKITVRCGIRIYTKSQTGWTKFGIPLEDLKKFYNEAKKYKNINLCGIQFHISWNKNSDKYVKTLKELGDYFAKSFSKKELEKFEFIDIGGGFYPEAFEGAYPWNQDNAILHGEKYPEIFEKIIEDKIQPRFIPLESDPIEKFGKHIAQALKKEIFPIIPKIEIWAEPGRFICHSSMHFLLKVMDIKNNKSCIVDGGNNMIGWEKYQLIDYAPIFNLTHFTLTTEKPLVVYGSLCTPDDIWGYYVYGTKTVIGDILLMPFQGAYTFTLAQEFIKNIPKVYNLN